MSQNTNSPSGFSITQIIQEYNLARHSVVACGDAVFRMHEFKNLCWDANGESLKFEPEDPELHQRFDQLSKHPLSSHLETLWFWTANRTMSLWSLVMTYSSYRCFDSRDRVFGLLALANRNVPESRVVEPDYTKSSTEVVLQLLDLLACNSEETLSRWYAADEDSGSTNASLHGVKSDMAAMLTVVRSIESRSEQTGPNAMVRLRRSLPYDIPIDRDLKSQYQVAHRENLRRISIQVCLSCTVSESEDGDMVAPLCRDGTFPEIEAHDFAYVLENTKDNAVSIHDPVGTIVAVADKNIKGGDTILCFSLHGRRDPALAGLIARPAKGAVHAIVGQVVFDEGVRPYGKTNCCCVNLGRPGCECGKDKHLHHSEEREWTVYMSIEDVYLFLAQDMKTKGHDLDRGAELSMSLLTLRENREDTARRLQTRVTSGDLLSSYAVCELED